MDDLLILRAGYWRIAAAAAAGALLQVWDENFGGKSEES